MDVNLDQKFQQRWEFRRKDDEIDSSDDSADHLAKRRLQLVPVCTLPEDDIDDSWDDQRSHQKNHPYANVKNNFNVRRNTCKRSKVAKGIESSKKCKANNAEKNRNPMIPENIPKKTHRSSIQDPLLVEELKIFRESMISEIKTTRENMLVQMKEELLKLVSLTRTDTVPSPKIKSERKTQKRHGVAVRQCPRMHKTAEDRVVSRQALAMGAPDATERLMSSLQKPIELTQGSTQMVPTSHFTLPPHHLHPGSDLYFKNHLLPSIAANCSASNVDISNSMTVVDNHQGMIKNSEHLGYYSYPISSRHIGLLGDPRINVASAEKTGFPVLLHRPATNSLNVHSPMVLEDILRVYNREGPIEDGRRNC